MLEFDYNNLIIDVESNSNVKDELKALNDLFIINNANKFLNFIHTIDNTELYIKNWFKLVKINITKLLKKQVNIIDEVIEDINSQNSYSSYDNIIESTIQSYNEYLKNRKEL